MNPEYEVAYIMKKAERLRKYIETNKDQSNILVPRYFMSKRWIILAIERLNKIGKNKEANELSHYWLPE